MFYIALIYPSYHYCKLFSNIIVWAFFIQTWYYFLILRFRNISLNILEVKLKSQLSPLIGIRNNISLRDNVSNLIQANVVLIKYKGFFVVGIQVLEALLYALWLGVWHLWCYLLLQLFILFFFRVKTIFSRWVWDIIKFSLLTECKLVL